MPTAMEPRLDDGMRPDNDGAEKDIFWLKFKPTLVYQDPQNYQVANQDATKVMERYFSAAEYSPTAV